MSIIPLLPCGARRYILAGPTPACFASLHFDLADQANSATLGHAQGPTSLAVSQQDAIVDFESGLYTAQFHDDEAGVLDQPGGGGGPRALSRKVSYFGINDAISGDLRTGAPFNPVAMTLYTAW